MVFAAEAYMPLVGTVLELGRKLEALKGTLKIAEPVVIFNLFDEFTANPKVFEVYAYMP